MDDCFHKDVKKAKIDHKKQNSSLFSIFMIAFDLKGILT